MNRQRSTGVLRGGLANQPFFCATGDAGGSLVDSISRVFAACSISGTRYGIVNGVVTQFEANQPPIEDDGLRGCPAFTQLAIYTDDLTKDGWALGSGTTGVSRPGGNRLIYSGGSSNLNILYQSIAVPGGTASKILTAVARVSANSYPQKFRIINTHGGVVDNFSNDITLNEPTSLYLRVQNSALTGFGKQNLGIAASTDNKPFDINIGMNLAEANFIYPYTPNNTTSIVSYVSEAATATTGTSFDLDDAKLARLKTALRGPNAQGHLELTFKSNTDSSWWANNSVYNILSVNNTVASLLYINKDSSGVVTFRATDGTNVASITQGLVVGSSHKVALDWGAHSTGQKIRITVNGVKSSLVDCGSSLGAEDLMFFALSGIHAGWIVKDSLKIYERPQW